MTRNPRLLEHAGLPLDALPEDVVALLEANPALKQEFEQQARMMDLMQLKNYEQPEEAMFGRVQHRVTLRLQNGQVPASEPLMGPLPAWARMVAVVAVMVGLSVLTHREMLRAPEESGGQLAEALDPSAPWSPEVSFEVSSDPFAPFVFSPTGSPGDASSFVGLTEKLEEDFELLGLGETNRLDNTSLLPVRLTPGQ